jgi:Smg protein
MKDNFLEMLLSLFEQTLTQLKEAYIPELPDELSALNKLNAEQELNQATRVKVSSTSGKKTTIEMLWFRSANSQSTRVFTAEEQLRFTRASQQFLKRLRRLDVLSPDAMELVINRLMFSESRFVNLQETKWAVRNTFAERLSSDQLAFLDLVLYQKEDGLALH